MLDIAEVAKRTGLTPSTLRFYEEKELIKPISRKVLRRQYAEDAITKLRLIIFGQQAGFSLKEIRELLASGSGGIDKEKLLAKARELDETIKQLEVISKGLKHAANCSAPTHMACPKFQRIMKASVMPK